MKTIEIIFSIIVFIVLMSVNVFAATAKTEKTAAASSKGKEIVENSLDLTVSSAEMEYSKDKISISLDGAEWSGYSESGEISVGLNYEKTSPSQLNLHIDPTKLTPVKNNYTVKVPLKCKVTADLAQIKAVVNWGIPEYSDTSVVIAKCSSSKASLNGKVIDHKKGDIILKAGKKNTYNKLSVFVAANDVERTRYTITIKYDGANWSDYDNNDEVSNNRKANIQYKKIAPDTIKIEVNEVNLEMRKKGYTMTLPLSGTITGDGLIKAIVDYGVEDIPVSEVTFARCKSGTVELSADSPEMPVDLVSKASDVVINDSTIQGFAKNSKIELELNLGYRFKGTPQLECSEKFDGKVSVKVNDDNKKKCTLTFTKAVTSGTTGTIKLKNIVVERPESNVPNVEAIKMTMTAKGWEEYSSSAQIGKYQPGSEYYQPQLKFSIKKVDAAANNEYAFLNVITISDISSSSYKKGDKIEFVFDNGFVWFSEGALPKIKASGKFEKKCAFEYDNGKGYIVFTDDIPVQDSGTITVTNAVLKRVGSGEFEVVNMTAGLVGDSEDRYSTIKAVKFSSILTKVPETTTVKEETTEATTENSNEAKDGNIVKFRIGYKGYTVNEKTNTLLAEPYIKDGYTMLPMRALANLVGIDNDHISYNNGTAEFIISDDKKLIVTAKKGEFTLGDETLTASTPAEIVNGTMFLPMRDLLNALGVENDKISFDTVKKEVTVIID